jgi:hypothetical protein
MAGAPYVYMGALPTSNAGVIGVLLRVVCALDAFRARSTHYLAVNGANASSQVVDANERLPQPAPLLHRLCK